MWKLNPLKLIGVFKEALNLLYCIGLCVFLLLYHYSFCARVCIISQCSKQLKFAPYAHKSEKCSSNDIDTNKSACKHAFTIDALR